MPVVVANANAPRLGIALPYAPVVNGVPKPKANGGITLGAPKPFTGTPSVEENGNEAKRKRKRKKKPNCKINV